MASVEAARVAVDGARTLAADLGRDDLVERLRIAVARMTRPATVVCVVGEFKQGKSSLVNALLDQELCPVDDDIATSVITLVRYGEQPAVEVRRRDGDRTSIESIDLGDVQRWVT